MTVILPTIRPALIGACLENLSKAAAVLPIEVTVVADFSPGRASKWHEDLGRWIVRPRAGTVDAINAGYAEARGEFVFVTNDETMLTTETLPRLYAAGRTHADRMLTPRHVPTFPFMYYWRTFAPFPFATPALLERVGGLFDPCYHAFYADPDLSLRCHAQGVRVETVKDATITHRNDIERADHRANVSAYLDTDRATFRTRWDHLGTFCDP